MSRWSKRREQFRTILSGAACVYPGSVFDPVSARIAEDLGFEVGMFAGSIASLTVLGAPDLITLTLTEFSEQTHRICRASNLPLMCDADHGYGNALNVRRTVEELDTAGVAAMSIEDTALPMPFGSNCKPLLLSVEEGVGKMCAALDARHDPSLVVAGRTGALLISGIEDAIFRAKAYEDAGVDAIFLTGVKTRVDLDRITSEISLPLILGGAGKELFDRPYLGSRGVRICLQGHQPFMAAVKAVHDTLAALREGESPQLLEGIASDELMQRVMRNEDYTRWIKDWL